jgi:hypothetical protein
MTMNFRLIKASLVKLLGDSANGRYRVAGFQKRGQAAIEIKDKNRIAQVYYSQGTFPKSGGGPSGPQKHDMTFNIDLSVSMPTKANLAVLNGSPSPAQIQTVLGDLKEAENLVDDAWDEFADDIYQVIMNALNLSLGLDAPVANRWISNINKDNPTPYGELVTLTGTCTLTCSKDEQVDGATPVPIEVMDFEVEANNDTFGKAGVLFGQGDFLVERGTLNNLIERGTGDLVTERPEPEA